MKEEENASLIKIQKWIQYFSVLLCARRWEAGAGGRRGRARDEILLGQRRWVCVFLGLVNPLLEIPCVVRKYSFPGVFRSLTLNSTFMGKPMWSWEL